MRLYIYIYIHHSLFLRVVDPVNPTFCFCLCSTWRYLPGVSHFHVRRGADSTIMNHDRLKYSCVTLPTFANPWRSQLNNPGFRLGGFHARLAGYTSVSGGELRWLPTQLKCCSHVGDHRGVLSPGGQDQSRLAKPSMESFCRRPMSKPVVHMWILISEKTEFDLTETSCTKIKVCHFL